jgi:hypothetical protein
MKPARSQRPNRADHGVLAVAVFRGGILRSSAILPLS